MTFASLAYLVGVLFIARAMQLTYEQGVLQ
jgi:hypothetical protein